MEQVLHPSRHPLQFFLTDKMQMADVLTQILAYTGRARVTVTTFSVAEEFLAKLHRLKQKGLVSHFTVYADHKAAEKTARINAMARQVCDALHLCANHSKVMLVETQELKVCVATSQNLTRGNRMEAYVIMDATHMDIASLFDKLKISTLWTTSSTS